MRLAEVFSREPNPIRVAHSPGNSNGRTRQRLYPAPPGSFSSDLLDRALAPVSADLTSDLARGDLVPALFLCSRSNGRKSLLFRPAIRSPHPPSIPHDWSNHLALPHRRKTRRRWHGSGVLGRRPLARPFRCTKISSRKRFTRCLSSRALSPRSPRGLGAQSPHH